MGAGEGRQQPRRHIYHKHGRGDGEGGCSGGVETYSSEGKAANGLSKKMRDLMYTCKLMTAEGINLALEDWRGVVDKSSGRLSVLPVVIDIRGVPCRQKEVHKEDDRCTVRRGSVLVCKTEDSSEAQTGQKEQERRMTLEWAAAQRVRAWSLMLEYKLAVLLLQLIETRVPPLKATWLEWWISWIIHTWEDGMMVIVLAKCCDD